MSEISNWARLTNRFSLESHQLFHLSMKLLAFRCLSNHQENEMNIMLGLLSYIPLIGVRSGKLQSSITCK